MLYFANYPLIRFNSKYQKEGAIMDENKLNKTNHSYLCLAYPFSKPLDSMLKTVTRLQGLF
jgi:hypothetical protein